MIRPVLKRIHLYSANAVLVMPCCVANSICIMSFELSFDAALLKLAAEPADRKYSRGGKVALGIESK